MSISPIITFKAGKCEANLDASPLKITPVATPGFLYLYSEDELLHFCWRPRDASLADPDLDLVMVPTDAYFKPYLGEQKIANTSPINGRVFVLKFRSSAQRHWFWLQSREQPPGQPKKFSTRDLRLGEIVNSLLQGEELDASSELASLRNQRGANGDGDDDAMMEDVDGQDEGQDGSGATGGAGSDVTGGDTRDEGEGPREGGGDGARAGISNNSTQSIANAAIQNFLKSMRGGGHGAPGQQSQQQEKVFTTLGDLLTPATTIHMIDSAEPSNIENLLVRHLPPALVFLEHQLDEPEADPDEETLRDLVQALDVEQQKNIVKRVLRSPQFSQGLASLTSALRDGGLPTIGDALQVPLKNRGYAENGAGAPVTGGNAVEAFLEGVKKAAQQPEDE